MSYNAIIETITNDLLRGGYSSFIADVATETYLTDVPPPIEGPVPQRADSPLVHRWNGLDWDLVSKALTLVQNRKLAKLSKKFTKYLEKRYSPAVQRSLTLLMAEANSKNFTQRAANVQQGIDWVNAALGEFYAKRDVVLAAISVAAIDAVELDFDSLDASDPELTLEGARAILN